jgi:Fe-S-cluster containining protein
MNFQNVVFPDSVGFQCKKCGVCCALQPPDLNKEEQKRIESRGYKNFLAHNNETGISWIRRNKDNSCIFLTKENKCAIYDIRPAICRLEPFTISDFDFEKNRIELELDFPFACGCEGVCKGEKLQIDVIGKAAQAVVQEILAITAQDLGLPISDKKVASETRARILRRRIDMADLCL